MPDKYVFRLSSGIVLTVTDELGLPNTWEETPPTDKLPVTGGNLGKDLPPMICMSPGGAPAPVVTLHDATWDSKKGDTGKANVHLGIGTPSEQTWALVTVT